MTPKLLALILTASIATSCTTYAKAGAPCDTVGAEGRGKNGGYYQCKADPDGGPARWRHA